MKKIRIVDISQDEDISLVGGYEVQGRHSKTYHVYEVAGHFPVALATNIGTKTIARMPPLAIMHDKDIAMDFAYGEAIKRAVIMKGTKKREIINKTSRAKESQLESEITSGGGG